jgi:hypothetical protein
MAGQLGRKELHRLARLGAEARLIALEQERADILRSFPDLGRASKASPSAGRGRAAGPQRRRRQSRMSAAARKAVSLRMKKYWAERRKGKNA